MSLPPNLNRANGETQVTSAGPLTNYENERRRIDDLERGILDAGVPLLDLPTRHLFTPGLYIREVKMPAGTLWTTRQHKTEHPFVMSSGRVSVYCDGKVTHLTAPFTGITVPGTRRVIHAHEDTIWTTFHANPENESDVLAIEQWLVEPWPDHLKERHSLQPPVQIERKELVA